MVEAAEAAAADQSRLLEDPYRCKVGFLTLVLAASGPDRLLAFL